MLRRKHFTLPSGESNTKSGKSEVPKDNPSKVRPVEGGRDWSKSRHPERRCTARRSDGSGEQCRNASLRGQRVCRYHGGAAKQSKAAARRRIDEHADPLVRAMIEIAQADDVSPATRVAAIKDLLDRADITGKTSIEVEVGPTKPWERILSNFQGIRFGSREESRARRGLPPIERRADEQPPVIDAEVVEDGPDLAADERTRRKRPTPRPDREPSPTVPAEPQYLTGMAAIEEAARANRAAGVYGKKRRR